MNLLKKGEGVPLINFEGSPGVPLLNFEGSPGVPRLNFKGVPGSNFKFWGGSQVPDPGILVPLLHHAVLASDHSQIIILYTSYIAQVYFTLNLFTKYVVNFKIWIDNWRMVLAKWLVKKSVEWIEWYKKSKMK